jgi:hypothetical protein
MLSSREILRDAFALTFGVAKWHRRLVVLENLHLTSGVS